MKNINECIDAIKSYDGPPLKFMEVCGTHTHSIFKYGIRDILPPGITLISGPGCPVCVTPAGYIDYAVELSMRENAVLCTFGDMVRVPGHKASLAKARASGGDVRIIYSPSEVLGWAQSEPDKTFYVAAVGFETTIPAYALLLEDLSSKKLRNVRLHTALKALMPALNWICENERGIDGFIGPGHVSAIIGRAAYEPLCSRYKVPLVIAGFGFEHIAAAVFDLINQCRKGTYEVHNLYPSAVTQEGNKAAAELISKYFVKKPSLWRGLGQIVGSGYFLSAGYEEFDAGDWMKETASSEPPGCLCGSVITGSKSPRDCALFARACTPSNPVGPCMVSGEGACGIWYRNGMGKRERL